MHTPQAAAVITSADQFAGNLVTKALALAPPPLRNANLICVLGKRNSRRRSGSRRSRKGKVISCRELWKCCFDMPTEAAAPCACVSSLLPVFNYKQVFVLWLAIMSRLELVLGFSVVF